MPDEPLVLGIETSCDETGVGIVRGHTLLADALASSVAQHARFGGAGVEVASRGHLQGIVPTMQGAAHARPETPPAAPSPPRRRRRARGGPHRPRGRPPPRPPP